MNKKLSLRDKLIGGGAILILLGVMVVGNINPVQADVEDTAITLNFTFSEIKELIGMFMEGGFGASSGPAHWQMESFLQGVSAGARDEFSVGNDGVITTQIDLLEATGTSTIAVQATAASTGARLILEDSDGAGCSEIYVLNGTVISATVTCP